MNFSIEITEVTDISEMEDLAELASAIWHECYAQLLSKQQIEYMVEKFQSAEAMEWQTRQEGYRYFWVKQDNEAIGYLGLQAKEGRLLLSKCYLAKHCRGTGAGQAMLAYTENLAKELGCHTLWLTVNKGNERAKAAYEKAGMTLVRQQVVDIGGGFVMDDYVFEKPL